MRASLWNGHIDLKAWNFHTWEIGWSQEFSSYWSHRCTNSSPKFMLLLVVFLLVYGSFLSTCCGLSIVIHMSSIWEQNPILLKVTSVRSWNRENWARSFIESQSSADNSCALGELCLSRKIKLKKGKRSETFTTALRPFDPQALIPCHTQTLRTRTDHKHYGDFPSFCHIRYYYEIKVMFW